MLQRKGKSVSTRPQKGKEGYKERVQETRTSQVELEDLKLHGVLVTCLCKNY